MKAQSNAKFAEITHSIIARTSSIFAGKLKQIWSSFTAIAITDEPIIREVKQRSGESRWIIYDAGTDRRLYLSSEQEVRTWLDQRFYTGH